MIAAFGDGANEAGRIGGITERGSNLSHREVQAAIKIDGRAAAPKSFAKGFPRDQFAASGYQKSEQLGGLGLKVDWNAVPEERAGLGVEIKEPEANAWRIIHSES